MAFHPADLPGPARQAFEKHMYAPILWPIVVQEAVRAGWRDVNKLTDIVFYMHHLDRIGNPIKPGETKLIEEWKAWRTLVKAGVPGWSKPTSPKADLVDLLEDVDAAALGKTAKQSAHLEKMQALLVRGLKGEAVDDRYWQFTFYDGFGLERRCSEKHSLQGLKRHMPQQRALKNFERCAKGASTAKEVGKCLVEVEAAVACHTFVVIRWAHQNSATGDASLKPYTEYGYLRDLTTLAQRSSPTSIYWCYRSELETTFRHVG